MQCLHSRRVSGGPACFSGGARGKPSSTGARCWGTAAGTITCYGSLVPIDIASTAPLQVPPAGQ
eukprot:352544-Chlamydomonas_euryale.AAC.12